MTLYTADLFCGAGGITTGLSLALEEIGIENVDHVAINHWDQAIETHQENHPWARHINKDIEMVKPTDAVPGGYLDLLCAAPECTHHSMARGGKPRNDQSRAQPWIIPHWLERLDVQNVLIENVPEWKTWGPLDENGRIIEEKKGAIFDAYMDCIRALGYTVKPKILNAADYGDPTTRKRLFLVARKNHRPVFPQPTHAPSANGLPQWRPARSVIDWTDPGESIWTRGLGPQSHKKPLAHSTMRRIAEGIRRYSHEDLEPFADAIENLTPDRVALMQRTALDAGDVTEDLVAHACDPFLVKYYGTSTAADPDEPLPTVTGEGQKFAIAVPYLIGQHGGSRPREVEDPVMTVAGGGAISLTTPVPYIVGQNSGARPRDTDEPLVTVTTTSRGIRLMTPYLVPFYGERPGQAPRTHDVNEPVPVVPASKAPCAVTQPYLVQYHGQSTAQSVDDPVPTCTTRDRFALVVPELHPIGLDVRFRMLKVRELARAMGFPDSYTFTGTKTARIKQIGNAVCVTLAKHLCKTLLTNQSQPVVPPEEVDGFDPDRHRARVESRHNGNGHGSPGEQVTLEGHHG